MLFRNVALVCMTAIILSACGGHRITYSGYEESTEGVPGYINGKKVSPNIKLGQSYTVDGETYVPRFQPDYAEVGLASWYGPGFHGGKTANGEEFDKHDMTAAHPTLPLPSIVKVTMVETGKSIVVRINDRGPYAKGRIIDLSYAAAKEIGLIAKGTAKVKVEYMLAESQKFADLLADGRAPDDIDVASEVLPYGRQLRLASLDAAKNAPSNKPTGDENAPSLLERLNPIASAHAEDIETTEAAETGEVESIDLPALAMARAPAAPAPPIQIQPRGDPPALLAKTSARQQLAKNTKKSQQVYIQLGSFSRRENADYLQRKVAKIGSAVILPKASQDSTFYRVRMGPYAEHHAFNVLAQLRRIGVMNTPLVSN